MRTFSYRAIDRMFVLNTSNLREFRKGDKVVCDPDCCYMYFSYQPRFNGVAEVLSDVHENPRLLRLPSGEVVRMYSSSALLTLEEYNEIHMLTFTEILPGLLTGTKYRDTDSELVIHMEEGEEGRIVYKLSYPVGNFSKNTKVQRHLTRTEAYHLCRRDFTTPKFTEVVIE